jgi:ABC-type protease/lipase transport system fused ATPase/permease subunit
LLVLDDPNSDLDASGEGALNRIIAAMKAGGSKVAVAAHRLSLMAHIDRSWYLSRARCNSTFSPQPWDLLLANRNVTPG